MPGENTWLSPLTAGLAIPYRIPAKRCRGGYAIQSPLGTIYASNITPSKIAGIGDYTEQDFARAVRKGINKQGEYLYPAMPYTSYARITESGIHALYLFLMHGVAAVDTWSPQTHLPFPFSIRRSMALWNRLFATEKPFTPVAGESATINRGNYLANALSHCDTCHTMRNVLMSAQQNKARRAAVWAADMRPVSRRINNRVSVTGLRMN